MKKILRQCMKQVIILVIIIALVAILNSILVKTSIKGEYDTVAVGITKGAEPRELKKFLIKSFKEELDFKKKIEVEAVGSFGTEFRVKSDAIVADERDFMDIVLKKEFGEVSVSGITTNPEANYRVDVIMYSVYFVIVVVLGFGAVYFLSLIPTEEELNVKNIKKRREDIIEEENKKLLKEKKLEKKQNKKEKNKNKDKVKKEKKNKVKKDKKLKEEKTKKTKNKESKDKDNINNNKETKSKKK